MRCQKVVSFWISLMVIAALLSGGGCLSAAGSVLGKYADETGDCHPGGDYLLRKYGLNRGPASGHKCYQPQPSGAFLQSRKNVREHTLMGMSKRQLIREGICYLVKNRERGYSIKLKTGYRQIEFACFKGGFVRRMGPVNKLNYKL